MDTRFRPGLSGWGITVQSTVRVDSTCTLMLPLHSGATLLVRQNGGTTLHEAALEG